MDKQESLSMDDITKLKKNGLHQHICLLMVFVFFVSLLYTTSGSLIVSKELTLSSYGSILYSTSDLVPITGVNCIADISAAPDNIELISNNGGNALRILLYKSQITNPVIFQRFKNIISWCKDNNVAIIIACSGDFTPGSFNQQKADTVYNVNNLKTSWIELYSYAIQELQPDWVDCMNEPPALVPYTDYTISNQQFFEDYRGFVVDCIDAFISVKPDLKFCFESAPFWDLSYAFVSPRIDELRPNVEIIYDVHNYYNYENSDPSSWGYTGSEQPYNLAYWEGRLDEAKSLLFSYLLDGNPHIRLAKNLGLSVYFGEAGLCSDNPNWQAFMDDMFEFSNLYGLGLNWHSWSYATSPRGEDGNWGMLNSDSLTLNAVGQYWAILAIER